MHGARTPAQERATLDRVAEGDKEHAAALGRADATGDRCGKQPHTRAGEVNSFCFEMNTCSRSPGNRACSLQSIPVTE